MCSGSYTHLDVYKRQPGEQRGVNRPAGRRHRVFWLLYTSRCV
ncbi:hypothetical protein [Erwinia amylovora]